MDSGRMTRSRAQLDVGYGLTLVVMLIEVCAVLNKGVKHKGSWLNGWCVCIAHAA